MRILILLLFLQISLSGTPEGKIVRHVFTAEIIDTHADGSGLAVLGDHVTGAFSYDLALKPNSPSYPGEYFSMGIPYAISVELDGNGFSFVSDEDTRHRILVSANVGTPDNFALNVDFGMDDGYSDGGFDILLLRGNLLLPDLPRRVDPSGFEFATVEVRYGDLRFTAEIVSMNLDPDIPFVSIKSREVPHLKVKRLFSVEFNGVFQESFDLIEWNDIEPRPSSPYIFNTQAHNERFFRVRSE